MKTDQLRVLVSTPSPPGLGPERERRRDRRKDRDDAHGVANPEMAHRGDELIRGQGISEIEDAAVDDRGQDGAGRHGREHDEDIGEIGPLRAELEAAPQRHGDSAITDSQSKFSNNNHVKTVLNMGDQNVGQHRAGKDEGKEFQAFQQKHDREPVIWAPQRDPERLKLISRGHHVQREIAGEKRDPDQPEPRSDKVHRALCPRGLQRLLSVVQFLSRRSAPARRRGRFPP